MAEQDNTQQQQQNIDFNNFLQSLNLQNASQTDVLLARILAILQHNPNALGQRNTTSQVQSSVAEHNKWTFTREGGYQSKGDLLADFENGIKQELLDSLAGGNFKRGIQGALTTFQEQFGFDLKNVGHELGKNLTKKAVKAFDSSKFGQDLKQGLSKWGNNALNNIFSNIEGGNEAIAGLKNVFAAFKQSGQGGLSQVAMGLANGSQGGLSQGASQLAANPAVQKGATALAKGAAKLGPWGLLIAGIIITAVKVLGPALQGLVAIIKSVGKSFNREEELRKKRMENARKRMEADMEWMARRPFEILEEATKKWEDTWDNNLRKIGQTQGYDKEAVYALYESYAERLRNEGLSSTISAADISDKLASVLESGLSGRAAEEFAYIATKLNAAIPTQDFFGYVDTYASIAANALSQGASQEAALAKANEQLEQFASNLLYSSRELAGGFTTGLKDGSSLFKDAVEIAQTAKTYNASTISGTLTSVSAIVGSVAPDLANALVDNVVQAAIGGNNNSQLVALRSLANINASNTEFLRTMAENPKQIFSTLFTNLATMQNMSPDNYMEVAEGLAEVFGIDKAAFARVDFNYLANAIDAMNINNKSLQDNMELLVTGQTTTTEEQLKLRKINEVILNEGLAYIIDSEAGRMIQQHMWDEQRDNALMENKYSVDIQGAALEFLEGIRKSMTTLLNFLNPVGFIAKGISNMTKSVTEAIGNEQDIQEILQLGAVGSNTKSLYTLTTRGTDLKLTPSLIEMMGGEKGVGILNAVSGIVDTYGNVAATFMGGGIATADTLNKTIDYVLGGGAIRQFGDTLDNINDIFNGRTGSKLISRYDWKTVGKSEARALAALPMNSNIIGAVNTGIKSTSQSLAEQVNQRFEEFMSSAETAVQEGLTYSQWAANAKDYGISDLSDALYEYGRTESELKDFFETHEARQGAIVEESRKQDEIAFRDETRKFWDFSSGSNGIFQTAMWFPFFGSGQKYDTRMTNVDNALAGIQYRIGDKDEYTVIGGITELNARIGKDGQYTVVSELEEIRTAIKTTFQDQGSRFQRCLADWIRFIAARESDYARPMSMSSAWSDLQAAERDQQTSATLALANALGVFSADELKKLDPQLQANVLLGEIVVILQTMMQQNNTVAGNLSLVDSLSALGMGMTFKTSG